MSFFFNLLLPSWNWFIALSFGFAWIGVVVTLGRWGVLNPEAGWAERAVALVGTAIIIPCLGYAFVRPRRAFFILAVVLTLVLMLAFALGHIPWWALPYALVAYYPVILSPDPHGVFR